MLKFTFTNNLQYQLDAIDAVAGLFGVGGAGTAISEAGSVAARPTSGFSLQVEGIVVGNNLDLGDKRALLARVHAAQERCGITERSDDVATHDFSVEMETGTGKTYVYLRTIMELHKRYGLTKFIILVPSVAIREGVLKSLEQTRSHFADLYDAPYNYFAYDSSSLAQVRNDFAQSPYVQIMVMTVQSFNKDVNILKQDGRDDTHGTRYVDLIAATRPVVIMDEPQNMESDLSKASIDDLKPLFKLRYSATHKELHNLVYRLTPADAYKQGLVKKIEVYGVREDDANAFVFDVREVSAKKGELSAKVVIEMKRDGEYVLEEKKLIPGEDLFVKSKRNQKYEGLTISTVNAATNTVTLSDNTSHTPADKNENQEAIFRTQIRHAIEVHMRKQTAFGDRMKVLSLFFIDKVDNYIHEDSLIRRIFEEEYMRARGGRFSEIDAKAVHSGYFTRKGRSYADTTGAAADDKKTYDLIMKDKEKLLSLTEPVSFIFSHSALKEGWDNPNIFQICTLNETRSAMKKRQEIGRGLRLPVDVYGERSFNEKENVLTVIANESYRTFVATLQGEYNEIGQGGGAITPSNARERVSVKFKKQFVLNEDFKELWARIAKRTRYNVEVRTEELVAQCVAKLNDIPAIAPRIVTERGVMYTGRDGGMTSVAMEAIRGTYIARDVVIGDVLARIVAEVGITKRTAFRILTESDTFEYLLTNPEYYIRNVVDSIRGVFAEMLVNEGLTYHALDDVWEMTLFEDFESYVKDTIPDQNDRSVYTHVAYDSEGERQFAENLEQRPDVVFFTKLPRRFVVDTPLGNYNPDWAIVMKDDQNNQKLYLVRETKFIDDLGNLRPTEAGKIACAKKHFAAIGFDGYEVATKEGLSDLVKS